MGSIGNNYTSGVLSKPVETEVYNKRSSSGGNRWVRENAEASDEGNGIMRLSTPNYTYNQINRNTLEATGTIKHGFVNTANGSMSGNWVGVNWNNVKEVRGNTFAFREELKERGFKWDGKSKSWKRS